MGIGQLANKLKTKVKQTKRKASAKVRGVANKAGSKIGAGLGNAVFGKGSAEAQSMKSMGGAVGNKLANRALSIKKK